MKRLHHTGTTRRYHTVPGLEQDVAAHSWGVAIIILQLHPAPSVLLLKAALLHDCAEKYVGDLPATSKWASSILKAEMDAEEARWERELGIDVELNEFDRAWLKAADMLELVLFCEHALKLGNLYAEEIRQRGINYLHELRPLPREVAEYMHEHYWA